MNAVNRNIVMQVAGATRKLHGYYKKIASVGRSAIAGAAGAAVVLGNAGRALKNRAADVRNLVLHKNSKKQSGEVIEMKKSTVIALLVALAAVAGVLGALYFYVLRREKELDEYEQLLFSEDFNDDFMDDAEEPAEEPEEKPAPKKAKA